MSLPTTFSAFEVYFMVALLYLAITLSLSLAVRRYERWAARAAR